MEGSSLIEWLLDPTFAIHELKTSAPDRTPLSKVDIKLSKALKFWASVSSPSDSLSAHHIIHRLA